MALLRVSGAPHTSHCVYHIVCISAFPFPPLSRARSRSRPMDDGHVYNVLTLASVISTLIHLFGLVMFNESKRESVIEALDGSSKRSARLFG